jgi:hypothetical protein
MAITEEVSGGHYLMRDIATASAGDQDLGTDRFCTIE